MKIISRLYWHGNISITNHSTRIYCHRANNSKANFTNISIVLNGVPPQYFILFLL